ncbi:ribonuclease H-like domain-containing protein [Tanacetum coccineum]
MTRRVLLKCDSSGDLYPVTAPSPIPHVFIVSQHTWHQRLGHPGNEVLRCLVSNNFISCNNEKPLVLCHACQFAKHVRLPFVSSNTVVSSCFDIIHSDVWTSPILSLSFSCIPGTIRTVLSPAVSRNWPIHQLDVKNAFLYGDLSETIYMHQPSGFWDSVHPDYVWLFLSQKKYAVEILDRAHMVNCNPSRTPIDTESKLEVMVIRCVFYMQDPLRALFFWLFKRIMMCMGIRGTDFGYGIARSSSTTDLVAYLDADWAGCPIFVEAEYRGVANIVAETCWLRNLLRELHTPLPSATLVYCDNVSAVYLSCNPVQHQRTKDIEIGIHFILDLVATSQVRVLHVPFRYQFADIFTKGLHSALFEEFHTSLSIRSPPVPTGEQTTSCPMATKEDQLKCRNAINKGKLKKQGKRQHDEAIRSEVRLDVDSNEILEDEVHDHSMNEPNVFGPMDNFANTNNPVQSLKKGKGENIELSNSIRKKEYG